jgi:hypothetical protein
LSGLPRNFREGVRFDRAGVNFGSEILVQSWQGDAERHAHIFLAFADSCVLQNVATLLIGRFKRRPPAFVFGRRGLFEFDRFPSGHLGA